MILHWLTTQGYDVVALCLDLGQKVDDLDEIRRKGATAGASKVLVENVQEEFVREYVFPALQWNAIYEGTYLLGTSLARPLISKKQIECAVREGAVAVSRVLNAAGWTYVAATLQTLLTLLYYLLRFGGLGGDD